MKNIEEILYLIQDEVEITKNNMEISESAIADVNTSLEDSNKAFNNIYNSAMLAIKAIRKLSESLVSMDSNKERP